LKASYFPSAITKKHVQNEKQPQSALHKVYNCEEDPIKPSH
jgi:hypothetical protein